MESEHSNGGFEIESYLDGAKSEGVYDSEGRFTVVQEDALRKMAEFALPRRFAWVSKMVQAAVTWRCEKIDIVRDAETIRFHLDFIDLSLLPTEAQLKDAIASVELKAKTGLDHLAAGLRAIPYQAKLSFLLVLDSGEGKRAHIHSGSYFLEVEGNYRGEFQRGGLTLVVSHVGSGKSGVEVEQQILKEIRNFCYLCPIPISIHRQMINGLLHPTRFPRHIGDYPLLVEGIPPSEKLPRLEVAPDVEIKFLSFLTSAQRAARSHGGERRPFGALLLLTAQASEFLPNSFPTEPRPSRISWVRAGVVVDTTPLPWTASCLSCHFHVSAEGLTSDASGFKLVKSEERAEREAQVCRRFASLFESRALFSRVFSEDTDEHSRREKWDEIRSRNSRALYGLLSAGAIMGIMTFSWPATVASAVATGIAFQFALAKTEERRNLLKNRRLLEKRLEDDRTYLARVTAEWTSMVSEADWL